MLSENIRKVKENGKIKYHKLNISTFSLSIKKFKESILTFERHYNCDKLITKSNDTIFAIIKGGLFSSDSKVVLSPGEVVRTETIKKLSQVFKIKDYIDVLVINKNVK